MHTGFLPAQDLGKDMAYGNFYTEVQHDKITDRETVKLGFSTTAKTKPLIIDQLRAAMRENELPTKRQNNDTRDADLHRYRKWCDGSRSILFR